MIVGMFKVCFGVRGNCFHDLPFQGFYEGLCSGLNFGMIESLRFLVENIMDVFEHILPTDIHIVTSVHIGSYVLVDVLTDFPVNLFSFLSRFVTALKTLLSLWSTLKFIADVT